uniref:Uncharacterized protein n=1 Tax=Anguilla anguilla TaxID=7936 RepID=A0A0E9X4I7_ANGAN
MLHVFPRSFLQTHDLSVLTVSVNNGIVRQSLFFGCMVTPLNSIYSPCNIINVHQI